SSSRSLGSWRKFCPSARLGRKPAARSREITPARSAEESECSSLIEREYSRSREARGASRKRVSPAPVDVIVLVPTLSTAALERSTARVPRSGGGRLQERKSVRQTCP